jgi:hypothetical protein
MFSKQELDDIWETKPYGWFHQTVKNNKGKNKYTVTCIAFKEVEAGKTSATVYAKNSTAAINSISRQLQSKLNLELGLSKWNNKHVYRYVADNG